MSLVPLLTANQTFEDVFLQVGDEFALQTVPKRHSGDSTVGYLSCRQDGTICCDFVDGTDMERTNPPHPENCRLILHTVNQYAATKRLRQLEQLDDVEPRQLERQRAAAASERWHNKSDFDVRTGQPSTFGQTHQLLASASRKFIQAEKRLAKEDHRALQCSLADSNNVDKQAWFRIMPGYATRVEGDRVRMGDSVILESVRMPGTYIHCDEAGAIEGDQFEVNIASEPTRFVIVPVAKYRDANQASHLVRGGSFVQIFQRESQSYMCRSHDGNVRMLHPAMQSLEATTANGDQDDVSRRADFTWEVEVPQMLWSGSAVRHSNDGRTMLFSLKDSMSGKFLHERDDGTCFFDDGDDTEEAQWSLQPFDEDTEEFLFDRTPFAIRNAKTKRVLHRSKQLAASTDDGTSYELVAVDEQSCTEEDLFTFRYLPDEWLRVFQEVSILMENFAAFAEDIKLASRGETGTDAQSKSGTKPKAVAVARSISVKATSRPTPSTNIHRIYRTYLRPYRFMREEDESLESPALSMLSEFLLPLTMSSDTDPLTRDGPLNVALQRLLTDFRLVPRIMSIIDDILTLVPSDEIVLKTHGQEYLLLIQYCFRLLKVLAKDNEHNSRILFAQLDRLIANLAQPFMVTGVVSEIFKSANLIRSCDPSVLQKSWSLAKQLRLATYIDFLCVLLSLEQTPIKANQDVCIEIIRTDLGKESANAYKMGFNSDIWAHAAESRQSLANFDIRNPSRDPENEPKRLVQRVNLANAQAESHGYSDAEDEERELVYHVALVKLAALLCAGRHRTSIDFFLTQPHLQFRYQDVLKVMQMNETPDNARLAHAQLMLSLFVDREPYELHVPTQETRILSSVKIASLNLGHPKRVDPYKDLRTANGEPVLSPTEGFTDLKDAIVSILLEDTDADSTSTKPSVFVVDAARPDRNAFVCEIIELSRLLLLYGIYDGGFKVNEYSDGVLKLGDEATDLAVSLLPVLDGRTDKTVAQNSCRFYMSQENRTVMRMKRSILQVFEILFGLRDSSRIERVLNVVHSDGTEHDNYEPKQNGATTIKLSETRTKLSMDAEKDFGEIRYTNPLADKDREASDSMVKLGHHEVVNTMDLGIATVDHARNAVAGFVKASAGRLADPLTMLRPTASLTEGLTQKVSEEKSQLARVALGELQGIRVFGTSLGVPSLTEILLDILLYDMTELTFAAFDTLLYYVFTNKLQNLEVIASADKARIFLERKDLVSEFRRLRKWLHEDAQCEQCIRRTQELRKICATQDGQNVLRHLNLEEYLCRVLRMRLPTEPFQRLLKTTLLLTGAFCKDNLQNQNRMSVHVEAIFLRLMHQQKYVVEATECIRLIVTNNEQLCTSLCEKLARTAVDLSTTSGRRAEYLYLLESVVVCLGWPITTAQIRVCRGVTLASGGQVSVSFLQVSCELGKDEWGSGPAIDRVRVMSSAMGGARSQLPAKDAERCKKQVYYYIKSLALLAACAEGQNSTTELICASILPFPEIILRLHEIFGLPTLQSGSQDVAAVKNCSVAFFRDVFVDSDSAHILRSLRRPRNGIWLVDRGLHADFSSPLAESFLSDLRLLLGVELAPGPDSMRFYIFEQIVQFFIQYARNINVTDLAIGEKVKCVEAYNEVKDIATRALELRWDTRESTLLKELRDVASAFISSRTIPFHSGYKLEWRHGKMFQSVDESEQNQNKWTEVLDSILANLDIGRVSGSTRTLGVGIVRVAKALWQPVTVPNARSAFAHYTGVRGRGHDTAQLHYSQFLVKPLRERLQYAQHASSKEQLPLMLTMLDAVRCIPYVACAVSEEQMEYAFRDFLNIQPLNGEANPILQQCQAEMVQEGWGLLCFELLAMDSLGNLHLAALQLLLALTGGGNLDVQDGLLAQLQDIQLCPTEVCAASFRRLLTLAQTDLKFLREDPFTKREEDGHACEVLDLMCNMTLNNHSGMQQFVERQPTFSKSLNLSADVVAYLSCLEHDLKDALEENDENSEWTQYETLLTLRASRALKVLIGLTTGPQLENQKAIVHTNILPVVNRLLPFCKYRRSDLIHVEAGQQKTPRRQLRGHISRLLLALLEGVPDLEVVHTMLGSLSWRVIHDCLRELKPIMQLGKIVMHEKQILQGSAHITKTEYADGPPISSDARSAQWLKHEAYRFITIVEKCMHGAQDSKEALLPMESLLNDTDTVEWFTERLGQVEIVGADDELQILYFWQPDHYLDRKSRILTQHRIERMVDEDWQGGRRDEATKLRQFVDSAMEVVSTIDNEDRMWLHTRDKNVNVIYRSYLVLHRRIPNNAVLALSLFICAICLASYDHTAESHRSQSMDTFGRLSGHAQKLAFYSFQALATLHLFACIVAFYEFLDIRLPVLLERKSRALRLAHLKSYSEGGTLAQYQNMERKKFLSLTFHAYGFKADIATEPMLRLAFSKFGPVTHIKVFKDDSSLYNSWAMVTFAEQASVRKLLRASERKVSQEARGIDIKTRLGEGHIFVRKCTEAYVDRMRALDVAVDSVDFAAVASSNHDGDIMFMLARLVQDAVNATLGGIGEKVPVLAAYQLRWSSEFWLAIADIAFSILGYWWSPLLFSYHLFRIAKLEGADIVVNAITTNWRRLIATTVLASLMMFCFAISGLLYFELGFERAHTSNTTVVVNGSVAAVPADTYEAMHDSSTVANEGGPCANLLTCFVSYFYAGFMQEGLKEFLKDPLFPEDYHELASLEFVRIVWEVLFMLVTSCVVMSIMTGIICDTFGELRKAQEQAALYRSMTCFITGITFSRVSPEESKATHYLLYCYLLLHLRRLEPSRMTRVERMIEDQVRRGEVAWLPSGRCFTLLNKARDEKMIENGVHGIAFALSNLTSRLTELEQGQAMLMKSLENSSA